MIKQQILENVLLQDFSIIVQNFKKLELIEL
jgi:hypothetical protein